MLKRASSNISAAWRKSRPLIEMANLSPTLLVPEYIRRPDYVITGKIPPRNENYQIHDQNGIDAMRYSSKKAAEALAYAGSLVKPGVSGDEVDRKVHEFIISQGCYPSPLGYMGFPKSICFSTNEVLLHGIPRDDEVVEGDIVSIDISLFTHLGTHGDNCGTFLVGNVDSEGKRLLDVTRECLMTAIAQCHNGAQVNNIGRVIENICDREGFTSVKEFSGHGIGQIFHRAPWIHHYKNTAKYPPMQSNMTFTIEPIICEGKNEIAMWDDDWTIVSQDNSRGAQIEHTILINNDGCEILTQI